MGPYWRRNRKESWWSQGYLNVSKYWRRKPWNHRWAKVERWSLEQLDLYPKKETSLFFPLTLTRLLLRGGATNIGRMLSLRSSYPLVFIKDWKGHTLQAGWWKERLNLTRQQKQNFTWSGVTISNTWILLSDGWWSVVCLWVWKLQNMLK